MLLFGLGLFAIGSMLSGLARSMPELIAMRVVQGLGAGAVGPIVLTMLGDLFTLQERARVQGLFSAVWGGSSLIGPALGGVLTDRLSWRWVFFVTVPFGLVAMWILSRYVHERVERKVSRPIDWWGAMLLTVGSTVLLMAVLRGDGAALDRMETAWCSAGDRRCLLGLFRLGREASSRPGPAARSGSCRRTSGRRSRGAS